MYTNLFDKYLMQLEKGVFVNVKKGNSINPMTITWGTIGIMFRKRVAMIMIRESRYTYELLEDEFTISVPANNALKQELTICGKNSGRDMDKMMECNFTKEQSKTLETSIISECELHLDCKVLYKHKLNEDDLPAEINDLFYKDGNYHVLIFGEIKVIY